MYKRSDEAIRKRLQEDFYLLTKKGYEVLGVFLQGSQNYDLDDEFSDIDTRAIVIPSFDEVCEGKTPTSTTIVLPSNEHIDVKDIREMFNLMLKQNPQYIELLFTPHYVVNCHYVSVWTQVMAMKEDIARYNPYATVNRLSGMSQEKVHALCHPYPSKKNLIEEYGYDGKQLHHILRMNQMIRKFVQGVPYADLIVADNREELMKHKRPPFALSLEEAKALAELTDENTRKIRDEYMQTTSCEVNEEVKDELKRLQLLAIKQYATEHLAKEKITSCPTTAIKKFLEL